MPYNRFVYSNWIKYILYILTVIALGFLQINVLPKIWYFRVKPDLLLVYAVIIALNLASLKFILFVLFCGLFKDAFGLHLFGLNAFMFCLDAGLIYFISRYIYKEIPGFKFVLVSGVTVLNYILISVIFNRPYIFIGLQEALLNCLALPLVSKMFFWEAKEASLS